MIVRRCKLSAVYPKVVFDRSEPFQSYIFTHSREANSPSCLPVIHKFDYVFAENGTVQYKDGRLVSKHVSEDLLGQVRRAGSSDRAAVMVMDCCGPLRPSRTKLGRSCCRT